MNFMVTFYYVVILGKVDTRYTPSALYKVKHENSVCHRPLKVKHENSVCAKFFITCPSKSNISVSSLA